MKKYLILAALFVAFTSNVANAQFFGRPMGGYGAGGPFARMQNWGHQMGVQQRRNGIANDCTDYGQGDCAERMARMGHPNGPGSAIVGGYGGQRYYGGGGQGYYRGGGYGGGYQMRPQCMRQLSPVLNRRTGALEQRLGVGERDRGGIPGFWYENPYYPDAHVFIAQVGCYVTIDKNAYQMIWQGLQSGDPRQAQEAFHQIAGFARSQGIPVSE